MNIKLVDVIDLEKRSNGDDYSPSDYDITMGYNLAIDEISQYEIDVDKLAKEIKYENGHDDVTENCSECERLAQHLVSTARKWIVRKL